MQELKTSTDAFLARIGCESVGDLSDCLMQAVMNSELNVFGAYLDLFPDLSRDYLRHVWQFWQSDRNGLKQDYTPDCITELIGAYVSGCESIYDQCAGSGSLAIGAWNQNKKASFVCEELDERVIPVLLFNLAIRNIQAVVINRDALTQEGGKAWQLTPGAKHSKIQALDYVPTIRTDGSISNPPYGIKWTHAACALNPMFFGLKLPTKNNANAMFILNALSQCSGRAAIILPAGDLDQYQTVRDWLVRFLDAVILMPPRIFESTSVGTAVMLFNQNKQDRKVIYIDHSKIYETVVREQRGEDHARARIYKKELAALSAAMLEKINQSITLRATESDYCVTVHESELIGRNWRPDIQRTATDAYSRPYSDIIADLKRVNRMKSEIKITLNESLSRHFGLFEVATGIEQASKTIKAINDGAGQLLDFKLDDSRCLVLSKSALVRIDARSDGHIPEPILFFLNMWKQWLHFLNNEENRYLSELRDKILPDLLSGKLEVNE